jgi:hypothetical protein
MTTPDLPRVETVIIEETNTFRATEQRAAVVLNPVLTKAARDYARFLATTGRFAHEADGRKPQDRTRAAGYRHCSIAENLASVTDSRGIATEALAKRMVEGWKTSPPHRAAMVLPDVTDIGVGLAVSPRDPSTWISVQLFGRPITFRYTFRIENATQRAITYTFNGKTAEVPTRASIEHTACTGGSLSVEGTSMPLTATDGAVFRVTDERGPLVVEQRQGR